MVFPNSARIYVDLFYISKMNPIVILIYYHFKYNVLNKTDMRQKMKEEEEKEEGKEKKSERENNRLGSLKT